MTQDDRDRNDAADRATLNAIRAWLMWACTSGLVVIFGVVWFGATLDTRLRAQEAKTIEEVARDAATDARLRAVEGAERAIATTIAGQAQTLRDIRDEQRELRLLIERYVRPPSAP